MKKENKSQDSILRQEAEEQLKKKSSKSSSQLSEAGILKLLHELQIHQIELEMQNEELGKAKEQADIAILKYTELYDHAPMGYFTLSKEGEIIDLNLCGASLLGKQSINLKNSMFGFFVFDDSKPIFNNFLNKVFTSKLKETCEIFLSGEGGKLPICVFISGNITKNGENCHITVVDITERKQAEEALKESEHALHTIIDSIPSMIGSWDINCCNRFGNRAYVDWFGFLPEEMKGKHIREVIGEERYKLNLPYLEKVLKGENQQFERTIPSPDGKIVRHSIASYIPDLRENKIYGFYALVTDVTSIKEAELKIQQQNEQLIDLNAAKDKFFAIIAHDLRSPFIGFLGVTKIMAEQLDSMTIKEIQKFAEQMSKSATNLFNLLENLLNWTSMKQGLIPFKPQIIVLADAYQDAVDVLRPNAEAKNITLNYSAIDQLIVFADGDMLKTVLRNLVSNAIKFTNNGGFISINAKQADSSITISVSDNGVGIQPDELCKLFHISNVQTTRGTADEKGTGLGLLLCKEFVEKHQGKIWVESEVGKGSDFKFTLPM